MDLDSIYTDVRYVAIQLSASKKANSLTGEHAKPGILGDSFASSKERPAAEKPQAYSRSRGQEAFCISSTGPLSSSAPRLHLERGKKQQTTKFLTEYLNNALSDQRPVHPTGDHLV